MTTVVAYDYTRSFALAMNKVYCWPASALVMTSRHSFFFPPTCEVCSQMDDRMPRGRPIKNHFVASLGEYVGTFLFRFFAFGGTQTTNMSTTTIDNAL